MYHFCRMAIILAIVTGYCCLAIVAIRLGELSVFAITAIVVIAINRRRSRNFTAFGTARWASIHDDLRPAGMLDAKHGLIIGRAVDDARPSFFKAQRELLRSNVLSKEACEQFMASIQFGNKRRLKQELVRLPQSIHTLVCAPSGLGKGVSIIINWLLACGESAVVVDFKGENYLLTSLHRQKVFGHRIVVLDPFKIVSQTPDTFNPLDFIEEDSPNSLDDCKDLAESLIVRTGNEHDPHWCDSAQLWIAALIALVVAHGESNDRSLQTVRTLLTNPTMLDMAIRLMCCSDAFGGMLARLGNQLTHFKDKELGSTLTTTNRFLNYLDSLLIVASTTTSSFNPTELLTGGRKVTAYLVLPPAHAQVASPLLRVWISSLLLAVVRGGLQEKHKVHFVLDESSALSHMRCIDEAVDRYRGYGVRLQFYFQSLGQLKKCFPDGQDQTLLSNVTQIYFGVNDLLTAEQVSNRLGESTIVVESGGTSTGTSRQSNGKGESSVTNSTNENDNWNQHARKLLTTSEILSLSPRIAITFVAGMPPIWTTLVRHYEESFEQREPGRLVRVNANWNVVSFSASFLFLALMCAVALSIGNDGRPSVKRMSIHHQNQVPQQNKERLPNHGTFLLRRDEGNVGTRY